jgi:CheY-like chemotaxis protein
MRSSLSEELSPTEFPSAAQVSSSMLHDVRTHLNQIIGYSEILVELAEDDGLVAYVSDLQKIRYSGRQLLNKINGSFYLVPGAESTGHRSSEPLRIDEASLTSHVDQPSMPVKRIASSDSPVSGVILVVDDGQQNRDILSRRLVRQGYEVFAVAGGLEALAVMRSRSFDLVLLDIMMPDMDGFEVLRQLKNDPSQSDIPVVMISALSAVDNIARCIALGADDYLSKPFDPTLLKARVGACLEKKQARDREKLLFQQLQQSFHRLHALEKQRDDLTNMIVHDLRTPLTSLIGGVRSVGL